MKKSLKIFLGIVISLFAFIGVNSGCSLSKYNITLTSNKSIACTMTGAGSYHVGQKVTIKAEPKDENSYTWRGWYSNNKLYTMDMSFDYIVKKKNSTFESRWSNIMINVYCYSNTDNNYENLENAEMILRFENTDQEKNGVEYGVDKELYDEILEKPDYKFLGWYYDPALQNKATDEDGVLKESKLDKTTYLYAKWEKRVMTLSFTSNSNLSKFKVYLKNKDTLKYTIVADNDLVFHYGDNIKVEVSNSGLTDGQSTFKGWNNNQGLSNEDLKISEDKLIIEFVMPSKDIEFNAEFNLPESGFEYNTTGTTCILTKYFGQDKVVNIPFTFMCKNVDTIGADAFKDSECEKIIISHKIKTIEDTAFYNVKSKIFFVQGSNFDLITEKCFKLENYIYIDFKSGYDIYYNQNPTYKNFLTGLCFYLNGNVANLDIRAQEEYDTVMAYVYLYNVEQDVTIRPYINITDFSYTTNLKQRYTTNISKLGIATDGKINKEFRYTDSNGNIDSNLVASINSRIEKENSTLYKDVEFYRNYPTLISSFSQNPNKNRVLPIENAKYYSICYTSEQLLQAVENGFRPEFIVDDCPAKQVYDTALSILRSIIDESMTDYEKVCAIHDYLVNNVQIDEYLDVLNKNESSFKDNRYKYRGYFLEGAILDKVANFTAYVKSLSLLLSMENIENERYFGQRLTGTQEQFDANAYTRSSYIWNRVKLEINGISSWYNIDIARDDVVMLDKDEDGNTVDTYEALYHKYFLVSDTEMGSTKTEKVINNDGEEVEKVTITKYVLNEGDVEKASNESYRIDYYKDRVLKILNSSIPLLYTKNEITSKNGTTFIDAIQNYMVKYDYDYLFAEIVIQGEWDDTLIDTLKEVFGAVNCVKLDEVNKGGSSYYVFGLYYGE